jgi:anaerobic selenocysteine-containing dehydrogenase
MSVAPLRTHHRICPFCEATCGLRIETRGREVVSIRGADDDVFSAGFVCPKAVALRDLDADPDRLRAPQLRRGGRHEPASWDEAFEAVERGLRPLLAEHGNDALAIYLGNPTVHNPSLLLYASALSAVFKTRNRFSASSLDQLPKQLACGLMFGGALSVPVPDIDRCDYLLLLGANPVVSNGSLFTVPDFRGRVRRMRARGGALVVVDPRRSETAAIADRHLAIRPGTDALLLAAIGHTLFATGRVRLGRLAEWTRGVADVERALARFAPERVASRCGIPAPEIGRLARELSEAPRAAVYARLGTTATAFGTLASWFVDVLNVLLGQLDAPGGAMFPKAAAFQDNSEGPGGRGAGLRVHRHRSRVSGAPEVLGEFPSAVLAEETLTEGPGRIRALLTIAGNPARSAPNSARLERALAHLDFMVSVDPYLNATTRFADVILPPPSPLEQIHFDAVFPQLAYRNAARYSPRVFEPAPGALPEWQILLRLSGILLGQGPKADVAALDALAARVRVQAATRNAGSRIFGRDPEEILAALATRVGPERLVDLALRVGPYGDAFGARQGGLTLASLEAAPQGVDLGPLAPRIPEVLRTPSGAIELAPELLVADLARLEASLGEPPPELVLVGRRQLRTNNSWMHNLPVLAKGRLRCTLLVHPDDARARGLSDGGRARVRSRAGEVVATVEVSDEIARGVVSLPHGWGHGADGARLPLAARNPGVNSNRLADERELDPLSGTSVLNGIPVEIEPAPALR